MLDPDVVQKGNGSLVIRQSLVSWACGKAQTMGRAMEDQGDGGSGRDRFRKGRMTVLEVGERDGVVARYANQGALGKTDVKRCQIA